jgi:hypothetical protein
MEVLLTDAVSPLFATKIKILFEFYGHNFEDVSPQGSAASKQSTKTTAMH